MVLSSFQGLHHNRVVHNIPSTHRHWGRTWNKLRVSLHSEDGCAVTGVGKTKNLCCPDWEEWWKMKEEYDKEKKWCPYTNSTAVSAVQLTVKVSSKHLFLAWVCILTTSTANGRSATPLRLKKCCDPSLTFVNVRWPCGLYVYTLTTCLMYQLLWDI